MNRLVYERIIELSENKRRHEKLKAFLSNWKYVALVSIGLLTMKVAMEQLLMITIRHFN